MTNYIKNSDRLNTWNLSPMVQQIILNDSRLKNWLIEERKKFPFPPRYIPLVTEFFLDNKLKLRLNRQIAEDDYIDMTSMVTSSTNANKAIYDSTTLSILKSCQQYSIANTSFLELKFDGECALFLIGKDILVNRLSNLLTTLELSNYL